MATVRTLAVKIRAIETPCPNGDRCYFGAQADCKKRQDGVCTERRKVWGEVSSHLAVAANALRRCWLTYHADRGHTDVIRRYMTEHEARKKDEKGNGKCEVEIWPKAFAADLLPELRQIAPKVNTGVLSTLVQKESQTTFSAPATASRWPRWMWTLADRGEFRQSSYKKGIGIPLRSGKPAATDQEAWRVGVGRVYFAIPGEPDDAGQPWRVRFVCDRWGRSSGSTAGTQDVVQLDVFCHGNRQGGAAKKLRAVRRLLAKIVDPDNADYRPQGVSLVRHCRDKAWYLHIGYTLPKPDAPDLDPARTAHLLPSAKRPWHLWIDGWAHWVGGRGSELRGRRRRRAREFYARKEHDRLRRGAEQGQRGRRKKALRADWQARDSETWLDYTKTRNYTDAQRTIDQCIAKGCGAIRLYLPVEGGGATRFLETAGSGKQSGSWPWYQFRTKLAEKCERNGIKLTVIEVSWGGFWPKNETQAELEQLLASDQVKSSGV